MAERVFQKKYDLIVNIPPSSYKVNNLFCDVPSLALDQTPHGKSDMWIAHCRLGSGPLQAFRLVITSEKYRLLFPEVRLAEDQSAKGYYVTSKNGGRLATMVGGVLSRIPRSFCDSLTTLWTQREPASDAELKSVQ